MTEMKWAAKKKRVRALLIHCLCIAAVLSLSVFVRKESFFFLKKAAQTENGKDTAQAYTDRDGVPYLTDLDSYYHVRLVNNYLDTGSLGDSVSEDGTPWDTLSHFPEGRSADYQPGIIWITAMAWRIVGGNLKALEYSIGAFVAALAALAAYLIGWRMGGIVGGVTGGLLVGCAPLYVSRTCYGRFDTDVFVILMEVLLILSATEILRASSWRSRLIHAACFVLWVALFSLCWLPKYSMLFAGLTLAGGILSCLAPLFCPDSRPGSGPGSSSSGSFRSRICRFIRQPGLRALTAAGVMTILALLLLYGPSVFSNILEAFSFSTKTKGVQNVFPNLLESIKELARIPFFPDSLRKAFSGYFSGKSPAVVNALGGAAVLILSLAGLAALLLSSFGIQLPVRNHAHAGESAGSSRILSPHESFIYFCVLGCWLAAGIYLCLAGNRFIEHLSIPVGLLAGSLPGRLFHCTVMTGRSRRLRLLTPIISLLLSAAALIPAITGAARTAAANRPSVSDSYANACRYIRKNAEDENAVIASWWDMGYYYESESSHPCLWDGGTHYDSIRALLVSKALTSEDLDLSRRILLMLATSGDGAASLLLEHADAPVVFDTLYTALRLDKSEGCSLLQNQCGLSRQEAEEAWSMMRPDTPRETYLILTYSMTRQIGWYEHYAGWDFTGTQPLPSATLFDYTPEGTPLFRSDAGQEYLEKVRSKETMWRLFFNAEKTPCFTPVFEWFDGVEHIRVWKVAG